MFFRTHETFQWKTRAENKTSIRTTVYNTVHKVEEELHSTENTENS
jgi:hypothetical protein